MLLTDAGRLLNAEWLASQSWSLAWGGFPGGYAAPWTTTGSPPPGLSTVNTSTVTRSSSSNMDALPDTPVVQIYSVVQGMTTYVQGVSYQLTGNDVDWSIAGANPVPAASSTYTCIYYTTDTSITGLLNEFGCLLNPTVGYAIPGSGPIFVNNESWTFSASPTTYFYLSFTFGPTNGAGDTISQLGLYWGTTAASGVPGGQNYLTYPSQIGTAGTLYLIDNIQPFTRTSGVVENFQYIFPM